MNSEANSEQQTSAACGCAYAGPVDVRAAMYDIGRAALQDDMREIIEGFIDVQSPSILVGLLIDVARAKAEHIRTNWQDEVTARSWDRVAARYERACK